MKRWYVIQVFAGYEEAVKADLLKAIADEQMQDFFGEVLIPAAKMRQFFDPADVLSDQQLFPGYMLIEMELRPESMRLVLHSPRVNRFLGGKEPSPLSAREIERIKSQMSGELRLSSNKHVFEINKEVEIIAGPFAGFVGVINAIDEEAEKLSVMVSIFGRMTPVELGFDQVKQ